MKKRWIWLIAVMLLCALPMMAGAEDLRGYVKGKGYRYVQLGTYPYEADGTPAPVLWRVLEVSDQKALLLTEKVIDVQQVIFESDPEVMKNHTYRRIASYAESDLYTWMNTVALDTLLGEDPLRNALIEEPGGGLFFIMTDKQFLNPEYGFSATRWNEQKSRFAARTPYAKERGVYTGGGSSMTPYWASTLKDPDGYRMQLVGYNGHLSWAGYTRTDVGIRPSVRVDLAVLQIAAGTGTKDDPFVFEYAGTPVVPQAEVTPAPGEAAAPAPEPTPEPTPAYTPLPKAEGEIVLSFLGDCSIGDSYQYVKAPSSYHTAVDKYGYAYPFSLVEDFLTADDLTVANLECVFTERTKHSDKKFNLVAAPDHVQILKEAGIELVNTVNNHCMDFNKSGYEDSLAVLDAAGIAHFGTINPWSDNGFDTLNVQQVGDLRIGFLGFTYPQENDKKRIANRIKTLKEEEDCDLVIVSLHWGRETHATPNAGQIPFAKYVIDAGADAIWGHHPHVIQPIHFYKGKPILYSTGNFTFGTIADLDPATGIFQLVYEKVEGQAQLKRLQVIPCETQRSPDFRAKVLTEDAERQKVFKKLVLKKTYKNCVNPPESFLETGIVQFENGEMLP